MNKAMPVSIVKLNKILTMKEKEFERTVDECVESINVKILEFVENNRSIKYNNSRIMPCYKVIIRKAEYADFDRMLDPAVFNTIKNKFDNNDITLEIKINDKTDGTCLVARWRFYEEE